MTLRRKSQKRRLLDHQGGRCAYCPRILQLDYVEAPDYATWDEVHPRSRGGERVWGNVVLACRACNSIKRNKDLSFRRGMTVYQPHGAHADQIDEAQRLAREKFEMEWEELPEYDE